MADVKIIDIDSEQWNMKDQKARDDIEALNTVQSATVSSKGLTFSFRKVGKVVTVNVYGRWLDPTTTGATNLAIIPAGFRPAIDTRAILIDNSSADMPIGQIPFRDVTGNYQIDIYSSQGIKHNNPYQASATWISE
ncbi:MAG: hypothetical protein IKU15_04885 [Clostridia bacterium]|nr:hypothetical protein [Spirochaetaceae bacterium]MBR4890605.1 hypothetical protein [Clostridia bacterium]